MEEPEKKKRQTVTSPAVVQRYIKNNYESISIKLQKELVSEFKAKVKENGDTAAGIIRAAIERYLNNPEEWGKPEYKSRNPYLKKDNKE